MRQIQIHSAVGQVPDKISAAVRMSAGLNTDDNNALKARHAGLLSMAGIRADAIDPSMLTNTVGKWYAQDQGLADAYILFGQDAGKPGEAVFWESKYGAIGRARIGNRPGVISVETEQIEGRSVYVSAEAPINMMDAQTASVAGLTLVDKSLSLAIAELKLACSDLFWHGDAANKVNGITGSTATVNGITYAGRSHPNLPVIQSGLTDMTASFAASFGELVDVIRYSSEAYSTNLEPDSVVMSPLLMTVLMRTRDAAGSGERLMDALRASFPGIRQWKTSQALSRTGPNGYNGLLAYRSGALGLCMRESMLPTVLPSYTQAGGVTTSTPVVAQVGGAVMGEMPAHVLGWFPHSA